jgi:hypothetical protein
MKKWIVDGLSEVGHALAAFRDEVETRHGRAMFTDPNSWPALCTRPLVLVRSAHSFRPPAPTPRRSRRLGGTPPSDPGAALFCHPLILACLVFELEGQVCLETLTKRWLTTHFNQYNSQKFSECLISMKA